MEKRKTLHNIITALAAQLISIVLSILMSLIVPKLLGIEGYAYWQLFIFYSSYAGLFHFGLVDGIYLRVGGEAYADLDRSILKGQFSIMMVIQVFVGVMLVILAFNCEPERGFVLAATAAFVILSNAHVFFAYIFQATNLTDRYSYSIIIDRVSFIVTLLVLIVLRISDFRIFVVLYTISKGLSLLYLLLYSKDILRTKAPKIGSAISESITNIRTGINLTISNVASMMIIGYGRQLIDYRWGIASFGVFSFALTLTNFIMQFVMQIGMVLFPALRLVSSEEQVDIYKTINDILDVILPLILCLYVPVQFILERWLPQYAESFRSMILLMPICIYDGKMNLLCSTYFKVLRMERLLLRINLMSVFFSVILCTLAAFLINNVYAMTIAMVITIILRDIYSEFKLSRIMNVAILKNAIVVLTMTACFVGLTWFVAPRWSFAIYTSICLLYMLANRKRINRLIRRSQRN